MKYKFIRLTNKSEVKYLDMHHGIVDSTDLAWPFPEEEALEIIGFIRNRGSYRGYHIDLEDAV